MSYNIEEITKEKFSKFGDFINPEEVQSTNINLNTTKSYFDLANIEIHGEDKRVRINLFAAKKRNFPLKIDMLENHPFSSQVFFPLGNNPFIVVVCPANEKPNLIIENETTTYVSENFCAYVNNLNYLELILQEENP